MGALGRILILARNPQNPIVTSPSEPGASLLFPFVLDAAARVDFRVGSDGHGSGDLSSDGESEIWVLNPETGLMVACGRVRVNFVSARHSSWGSRSRRTLHHGLRSKHGAGVFQHGAQFWGTDGMPLTIEFCFVSRGAGAEELKRQEDRVIVKKGMNKRTGEAMWAPRCNYLFANSRPHPKSDSEAFGVLWAELTASPGLGNPNRFRLSDESSFWIASRESVKLLHAEWWGGPDGLYDYRTWRAGHKATRILNEAAASFAISHMGMIGCMSCGSFEAPCMRFA